MGPRGPLRRGLMSEPYAGRMRDLGEELERARAETLARLVEFDETTRAYAAARGDADGDDEHDPEGSTLAWERAASAASGDAARRHLADIDAALERVRAGWDGACLDCGRSIPAERLAARPDADRCVACASSRGAGPR